jgi:Fe-S oxidoreductase
VLLWPDTFDNYLTPDVAVAATDVLHDAGFRVLIPPRGVCCGLTWITTGQLTMARQVLRRTLDVVRPALDAGIPVVGLEPSCTAVLRGDASELMAGDGAAARMAARLAAQTFTLAEFLMQHAPDWAAPTLSQQAISQPHCHQHAVLGFTADEALLARLGVDNRTLDAGCCGLAGNFGFERGHYEVSKAVGELALLPAVRAASPDTLVLADGFSCRTQIMQETGRQALHLAQVVQMALRRQRAVVSA